MHEHGPRRAAALAAGLAAAVLATAVVVAACAGGSGSVFAPQASPAPRTTPGRPSTSTTLRPRPPARPRITPGAAAIGSTAYPIPATGVYFVSPTGSDSAPGTQNAPWNTVGYAVGAAPSGSTIVLRAGIYNESVTVTSKRLTIQNAPREAVILRGSTPVTDWTRDASSNQTVWTAPWSYQFPRQRPSLLERSAPLANAPDQVFFDNVQLQQVDHLAAVRGRAFYVDTSSQRLVIGVDPDHHTVESSFLTTAITLADASGSVVRGIQIDRYATPLNLFAPLQVSSSGVDIENVISRDNAAAGITVQAPGVLLAHDTFSDNAQLGVHGYQADGLVVDSTLVRHNNTEHFDPTTEAGGLKISTSSGVTVRGTEADHNDGDGLWFDLGVTNATIIRNSVDSNAAEGIQYEISSRAVIAANVATGNAGAGIRVIESTSVDVWNNTLYRNVDGIDVLDGPRPQSVQDVTIRNNILYDGQPKATSLLVVNDLTHQRTAAQMNVTVDANAYCRPAPATPTNVVVWAEFPAVQLYPTVDAFTQGTAQERRGITCDGPDAAEMMVAPARRDFALTRRSPGLRAGQPLSTTVAAALGLTPGVAVDLGVL